MPLDEVQAYRARQRRHSRHTTRRLAGGVPVDAHRARAFAAVDGEGATIDGRHQYMLLRAGDRELYNDDGSPLTTWQCISFLASLDPNRIYVSFFFDYDVTMICRGLPEDRSRRLLNRALRMSKTNPNQYLPVDWGRFQLEYLAKKEFRVRAGEHGAWGPWVTINDTGTFFQSSFVKALEKWFPEPEMAPVIAKIKEGKDQRGTFEGVTGYVREYCQLECNMLVKLMDRFRDVCHANGIHPRLWQGPGNLVSAVLAQKKFPKNKSLNLWDSTAGQSALMRANDAYYGGRFEASIYGDIKGPIYQYDINSAYPAMYKHLPCLVHGTWRRMERGFRETSVWLSVCSFVHKRDVYYCGLPVRLPNGTIAFPRKGWGTYWSHEIEAALPYLDDISFEYAIAYERDCACDWFDFVEELYWQRKKLGKDGAGIVLKLLLNSFYGKLAQSVGVAPYANPIWASYVTSWVRAQLLTAMNGKVGPDNAYPGSDVIMAATDGFFTTNPRDLPITENLGDWSETVHDSMFVVQSGVYFLPGGNLKTRGTPYKKVLENESRFREAWPAYLEQMREWKTTSDVTGCHVPVDVTNFTSLQLSLARGKLHTAGQWVDDVRELGFDWTTKRRLPQHRGDSERLAPFIAGTAIITEPWDGDNLAGNVPYAKPIGGLHNRARVEHKALWDINEELQPDWNPGGIIPGVAGA